MSFSYCIVSYPYASCIGLITSVDEERELFFLLSFTHNHAGFPLPLGA